jgi:hypothetical protein
MRERSGWRRHPWRQVPQQRRQQGDDAEALRQLQKLHQDGVITDREYEQKKAEILRRM